MNRNKLLLVIIFIISIIIILISTLIVLQKNGDDKQEVIYEEEESSMEELVSKQKISRVKNNNLFYTLESCLQKYITYLYLNYEEQLDELNMPTIAAIYGISTEEQKIKALINLLDKDYINENNINENNLFKYLPESLYEAEVKAIKINKLIDDNAYVEAYTAEVEINNKEKKYNQFFQIKIDNKYNTFCVMPIDKSNYGDLDEINLINRTRQIEKNDNNSYIDIEYSDGQISAKYFQEFKELMLNDYVLAFNKLDEEYRERRFGNIEEFKLFIENNKSFIKKMQIIEFKKQVYENYTEYFCKNLVGGYWIIKEQAPRDYTIVLDTYTIDLPEFTDKYKSATEQEKVGMNIDKIVEAINAKDYEYVYKKLDDTYKKNNFNSLELFKKYVEKNFFDNNDVEYSNYVERGNTYVYELKLKDVDNTSKTKGLTIIMQLQEGTNFVMSFNIK